MSAFKWRWGVPRPRGHSKRPWPRTKRRSRSGPTRASRCCARSRRPKTPTSRRSPRRSRHTGHRLTAARRRRMASDGPGVLIIDDQDDVRLALRAILSLDGWRTQEAASGGEALARIDREHDFDALVLDYRMPDLDGLEVARRARASGFERPIVICSAYLDPNVEREARAVGAQSVSKDNLVQLRAAVRGQLGGTARRQNPEVDASRLAAVVQSASVVTVAGE